MFEYYWRSRRSYHHDRRMYEEKLMWHRIYKTKSLLQIVSHSIESSENIYPNSEDRLNQNSSTEYLRVRLESGHNKWTNVELHVSQEAILDEIMIWLFSI
jgi:hypothetical protein